MTRFAATVNAAAPAARVFRRALHALRAVKNGPVLVAVANDVLNAPAGEADWDVGGPAAAVAGRAGRRRRDGRGPDAARPR